MLQFGCPLRFPQAQGLLFKKKKNVGFLNIYSIKIIEKIGNFEFEREVTHP